VELGLRVTDFGRVRSGRVMGASYQTVAVVLQHNSKTTSVRQYGYESHYWMCCSSLDPFVHTRDRTGSECLTCDLTHPGRFGLGDPTQSVSGESLCFELRDYFDNGVLMVNVFCQNSGLCSTHTDHKNFQNSCKFINY